MAPDLRQAIIDAGLAILREQGLSGLTQPRIAARTGLRQSHLTYYYPTRADLLEAVSRRAMELQIAAVKAVLASATSAEDGADRIAKAVTHNETTRVLAALNQVADQEPAVRALFGVLLKDFVAALADFLTRLGVSPTEARIDLVHSLFVGLSIINLATGRPDGERRAQAALTLALQLLAGESA